jgi:hypothetical protein
LYKKFKQKYIKISKNTNKNKKILKTKDLKVTTMGFEPIRLAAPPPQDGESTNFSTWPKIKKEAKLVLNFFL